MSLVINLDQTVSKYFTLRQLITTNTGLDNTPEPSDIENIKKLGVVLDYVYENVGPFIVHSAFRSTNLQNFLRETKTSAAQKKSFHELGLAADITPTTMPTEKFFAKIIENPDIKNRLGEISYKPTQNAIHISVAVPGKVGIIMEMDADGVYTRMSDIKIAGFLSDFGTAKMAGIGAIFMFLGGLFLFLKRRK